MKNTFLNVEVGDIVIAYDEYSRDLDAHFLKVEHIEEDSEYETETNPTGRILYGTDLEEEEWGDDYITVVNESTFLKKADEADLDKIGYDEKEFD